MTDCESEREGFGPILHMRGVREVRLYLAATLGRPEQAPAPTLETDDGPVEGQIVAERCGTRVYHFDFSLPTRQDAAYSVDGRTYPVNADFDRDDLRIAFVSCNGKEDGDLDRSQSDRNLMWERLGRAHAERPFHLLLHGGDQIYADEVQEAHPAVRAWARSERGTRNSPATEEVVDALHDALFKRYRAVYGFRELGWLMARVPSLSMWDDHDICDGWGSLRRGKLDAPVGKALFEVAREYFLLFQFGCARDNLPGYCLDRSGTSLSWQVNLPGLHLVAPDLRSERRPRRVMSEDGWSALREASPRLQGGHVMVLSSVPALGPRLSWLEALMGLVPSMQKYEDDLRDQWQSRAHREEWQRFLRYLIDIHERPDTQVTVLSGEIHLATRGTLETRSGPVHQLVASGIAHPAPPLGYARGLGALARFGASPLPDNPIRLHPLPGKTPIYIAQRNYLILEREAGRWQAWWELEDDGPTPALDL